MSYQLGVTQWSLSGANGYTMAMAKKLGIQAIQLEIGSYEKGLSLCQKDLQGYYLADSQAYDINLLPLALNALCDHAMTGGLESEEGKIAKEIIEVGVQTAADMKLEGVTMPSFFASYIHHANDYHHTVEALRYACVLAKAHDMVVYTENVLDAQGQTKLFADCAMDNLRLLFDSQNYAVFGYDYAVEVLSAHWDKLGTHLHVKDGGNMGSMLLGTGTSPFAQVMTALAEREYKGTIVIENNYAELPLRLHQSDYMENLRTDMATVHRLMKKG